MVLHHYSTLLAYLKQLKREGAEFITWIPKYEKDEDNEPNGYIILTINIKQKSNGNSIRKRS